ncbi:maleylacetoacetate isomerase [Sphingobium sp.]|jgi:maleylacetoacetate isomerase|uniref:maleylacetoacetate isomerase n=1 Tax=Sphingobium sp. TaxID=1912891 RepID=UPI000C0FE237|nr:maleylacetoacetate isomerase [Sphingobium sp.]PHQ63947.1 MAG: maleylacetoacetate isomerase [Sphingobium sp.]
MNLYSYFRSSAAYRVRIALEVKGIEHMRRYVDLKAGEQGGAYREINPLGLVPTIEEGNFQLGQSLAIIEYLEDCHPTPPLLPSDPKARAIVRSMSQVIACDVHPLNNLRVLRYLKRRLGADQEQINQWYAHWLIDGFSALEELVSRHGTQTNCFGSMVTLADICLAPQMWNARSMEIDLSAFPRLVAIDETLNSMPAFRNSAPEVQPDAM